MRVRPFTIYDPDSGLMMEIYSEEPYHVTHSLVDGNGVTAYKLRVSHRWLPIDASSVINDVDDHVQILIAIFRARPLMNT